MRGLDTEILSNNMWATYYGNMMNHMQLGIVCREGAVTVGLGSCLVDQVIQVMAEEEFPSIKPEWG